MNKAILMGRLTRDPELRTTQSGVSVASFSIAVDRRFKNMSGEKETDFINCKAWRNSADFITKYFQKGSMIAVVGSIQTGKYEKDGRTVYTTDIVVDEAYFTGSSDKADRGRSEDHGYRRESEQTNHEMDSSLPFDL
ncbi:MAG: single-stranded DNA-binding protein [Paludibacteraceae bacterium]|nr:single-stranded DNA-binding protein [Paludibacteraceae bacterium]